MLRLTGRDASNPIIFYDGACGLCSQWVQFVIRRDRRGEFRFAALQSEFAARVLRRHGARSHALDSMYVVVSPGALDERLLAESDAVLFVITEIGGAWWPVAMVLGILPIWFRDRLYKIIAARRYRLFGAASSCVRLDPADRQRFLDV